MCLTSIAERNRAVHLHHGVLVHQLLGIAAVCPVLILSHGPAH
jgi:hypothetical protein